MRPPRILVTGAIYHVTSQTNRKELSLNSRKEKRVFLRLLKRMQKRYSYILYAFNIMGNHFHLLIQPTNGANLSQIMQWLKSLFARDWNRRHNTCGHFWGERFFSEIIEDEEHFYKVQEYIEDNAVRAGLVKSKEDWPFSSYIERLQKLYVLIAPQLQYEYG